MEGSSGSGSGGAPPDANTNASAAPTPAPAPAASYYEILGVPKNATEKQIATAYKKLALKYHPDRNRNDEASAELFKQVNTAYHVLSDPNKRRQYDLGGESSAVVEFESVDVQSMGQMTRLFGAMLSRLGIPIPTSIAQSTLEAAQQLCRQGLTTPDPRLLQLQWGVSVDDRAERQEAKFFRLDVTEEIAQTGFFIKCKSADRSKFKLIMFDAEGRVRFQEESQKSKDKSCTSAILFFTNFDTYRLGDPFPIRNDETPAIFTRLEMLSGNRLEPTPGTQLVCVYGDNFLGRTPFTISALPSDNTSEAIPSIGNTDLQLLEQKKALEKFQEEFTAAREAFERVIQRAQEEQKVMEELLEKREQAYTQYIRSCEARFSVAPSRSGSTSTGSAFGDVTSTVRGAGASLFSTLHGGISSLGKMVSPGSGGEQKVNQDVEGTPK